MEFEQYKIISNSVQLIDVELESIECKKLPGDDTKLRLNIERQVTTIDDDTAEIFLRTEIAFDSAGPFSIDLTYKGICKSRGELNRDKLHEYAYVQVVPLLLPYARECVANIMTKMGLPVFYIPTIDILRTMSANEETVD